MGAIAARYADYIVVTSDNPRTEESHAILQDIAAGLIADNVDASRYVLKVDRRAAISCALQQAQEGDVVLIAGKGHEDYQIIGTTRTSFDDRLVAREILAELGYK
jgi:UDP-N-acetylmuramoyl-L-alanyl-D-glutamate--2,6-diaminopimelate ligase